MRSATTPASPARARRGFTLLEVMFGLALLGLGLTVLIKSAAGDIFNSQQAHMMGVATDLARGKMYDIEETLLKDGFQATDQHLDDQSFADEGWPDIRYSYKVELVEMPSFQDLQAMAQGRAQQGSGSAGSGSGSGLTGSGSGGFMDSALGGAFSMMAGNQDVTSAQGASFLQTIFQQFQEILKVSIRKITLTLNYKVMGRDQDPFLVVYYMTDAAAMDQVLMGMGSQDLPDDSGSGSGSGSGRGSGSGSGSGRTTGTPRGSGSAR